MTQNFDYIPPQVYESISNVFTHGANKHGTFGWLSVDPDGPKGIDHQIKKALGHIYKWDAISELDEDSGENHLAHAITRLIIALDMELSKDGPRRTETPSQTEARAKAEREFSKLLSRGESSNPKASRRD